MIVVILEQCQLHNKIRWRRKHWTTCVDCGNYPGLSGFTTFMRSFVSDASDPIYGSESTTGKGTKSVSYHKLLKSLMLKVFDFIPCKATVFEAVRRALYSVPREPYAFCLWDFQIHES